MNRGAVRTDRVAHLYRQTLRTRGAGLAIEALNRSFDEPGSPLRGLEGVHIALASYRTLKPALRLEGRLQDRRLVAKDTRLARANGWGSAGQCPAFASAKTPALRARDCRVAAAGSDDSSPRQTGDDSACVSASAGTGGGVL